MADYNRNNNNNRSPSDTPQNLPTLMAVSPIELSPSPMDVSPVELSPSMLNLAGTEANPMTLLVKPASISIPMELLTADIRIVARQCPGRQEQVNQYKVSPFHLAIGLIPPGFVLSEFQTLRSEFLGQRYPDLLSIPILTILDKTSTAVDIANYLLTLGVDAQKVSELPSRLTYQEYQNGELDPPLCPDDLILIEKTLDAKVKFLTTVFAVQEDICESKLCEIYQALTGQRVSLHLLNIYYNIPRQIVPHKLPTESFVGQFRLPYENYGSAIINGLAAELADRFATRSKPILAPIVHLTNASGTGKTRAAIEIGTLTNVLYCKLGKPNGFPPSVVWSAITKYFHGISNDLHVLQAQARMHVIIQRLLYVCSHYHGDFEPMTEINAYMIVDDAVCRFLGLKEPTLHEGDVKKCLFAGLDSLPPVDPILISSFEHDLHKSILKEYGEDGPDWEGKSLDELIELNKAWLYSRRVRLHSVRPQNIINLPALVIVIDEAHELMAKRNDGSTVKLVKKNEEHVTDVYRVLRGALRSHPFYWDSTLTLTISTLADAVEFYPPPEIDPSYRPGVMFDMHTPIVLRHTFDAFHKGQYGERYTRDWLAFMFSRARLLMIASCGRPLWAILYSSVIYGSKQSSQVTDFSVITVAELVIAMKKIGEMVKASHSNVTTEAQIAVNRDSMTSMLALSVAIEKVPANVSHSELVRVGGMALLEFEGDKNVARGCFCSEGIFNGLASFLMIQQFSSVMEEFSQWTTSTGQSVFNQGEIGEVVDRILLVRAALKAKRYGLAEHFRTRAITVDVDPVATKTCAQQIFEPVAIQDFLAAYAGEEAAMSYLGQHDGLKGAFVAFSHFAYMGKDDLADSPYDIAANFLTRGAALATKVRTPGVDAFIPLVLRDGRLSFIYVQTKLGRTMRAHPSFNDVATSSPDNRLKLKDVLSRGSVGTYIGERAGPGMVEVPEYCYIYRQFNGTDLFDFKVIPSGPIPQTEAEIEQGATVIHHQPCLSLCGTIQSQEEGMSKLREIVKRFCIAQDSKWLSWNESLNQCWSAPVMNHRRRWKDSELVVRVDASSLEDIKATRNYDFSAPRRSIRLNSTETNATARRQAVQKAKIPKSK